MADDISKLVLSSATIDVFLQNPGLDLTLGVAANNTVKGGCICFLRYGSGSEDLDIVWFDNGDVIRSSQTSNLNDFRESFECAAKYGMAATYCITHDLVRLSMVNLYPCMCSCAPEEGKGKGRPARDIRRLSGC